MDGVLVSVSVSHRTELLSWSDSGFRSRISRCTSRILIPIVGFLPFRVAAAIVFPPMRLPFPTRSCFLLYIRSHVTVRWLFRISAYHIRYRIRLRFRIRFRNKSEPFPGESLASRLQANRRSDGANARDSGMEGPRRGEARTARAGDERDRDECLSHQHVGNRGRRTN